MEDFGKKFRGIAAGLSIAAGAEANTLDVHKFPKDANPATITELLRPAAQLPGHTTEAVAVSVEHNGRYMSDAADPGLAIVWSSEYRRMLDQIQDNYRVTLQDKEIWLAHSHAADHIRTHAIANGLDEQVVVEPTALLNGPSLFDCEGFFRGKDFEQYKDTKVINIIVEPGGSWVCGGQYPEKGFSNDVADAYDRARERLLIATQSKKKNLPAEIRKFEQDAYTLIGLRVQFVPHGSSNDDFERAKQKVFEE